jgi:hypothetical protein
VSEPFDLSADDQLLRALDGMLDEVEPLPAHLTEYARALFDLGGLDSELAQLIYDSRSDLAAAPVRDDRNGGRVIVCTTDDSASVELVIAEGVLQGQIVPSGSYTVRVQTPTGESTVISDPTGSFQLPTPTTPFRLLIVGNRGSVVTVWIDP